MAKKNASEMQAWARLGVRARLAEIDAERAAILKAFPGLKTASAGGARGGPDAAGAGGSTTGRRMSAAGRKRISDAQKRRWAAQKAAKR